MRPSLRSKGVSVACSVCGTTQQHVQCIRQLRQDATAGRWDLGNDFTHVTHVARTCYTYTYVHTPGNRHGMLSGGYLTGDMLYTRVQVEVTNARSKNQDGDGMPDV